MPNLVLDASLVLASLLPDEANATQANAALEHLGDGTAFVPSLWVSEVANALIVASRRGRIPASSIDGLLDDAAALPLVIDPADPAILWTGPLTLALRHRLTLCDATYLDLALRLGVPLASFDATLRASAAAERLVVLP